MVDVDTNGVGSTDFTGTCPDISANGQFVAFSGPDGALVPLDSNGANDVFVRDASAGMTQLISQRDPAVPTRSGDRVQLGRSAFHQRGWPLGGLCQLRQ